MATRLLVHVEGQTEETFVNELLAPHLAARGYSTVSARLLGTARLRSRRGGIIAWSSVRRDIIRHLRTDAGCVSTTMVDYYGMPKVAPGGWPGRAQATVLPFAAKAASVEDALLQDVRDASGADVARRFVPFVTMHEFEGLLFSNCAAFGSGIGRPDLTAGLQAIRDGFASPEEINDSPVTAPSKRVEALVPGYQKDFLGNLAALEIGLDAIQQECPHFREWLVRLEALAP